MFPALRTSFLAIALVVFGLARADAKANWITLKNDTGTAIVVQETEVVNGQVKRGKATNLLAGETTREFIPGATVKRVEVYDAKNPNQPLWTGNLNCKDSNQTFSVAVAGGKWNVSPVTAPKK